MTQRVERLVRRLVRLQVWGFCEVLFFLIVVNVLGNVHSFKGPSGRLQEVRLFLRAFVLYSPWIPGEHCRAIRAVECVTAHLRGFGEDSRSEGIWLHCFNVEEHVLLSALQHIFAGLERTRDQKEFGFTVSTSRNMSC